MINLNEEQKSDDAVEEFHASKKKMFHYTSESPIEGMLNLLNDDESCQGSSGWSRFFPDKIERNSTWEYLTGKVMSKFNDRKGQKIVPQLEGTIEIFHWQFVQMKKIALLNENNKWS